MVTAGGNQEPTLDHNEIEIVTRNQKELEDEILEKLDIRTFTELAEQLTKADDLLVKTNQSAYKNRIQKLAAFKQQVEQELEAVEKIYREVALDFEELRTFSEANGQRELREPVFLNNFE